MSRDPLTEAQWMALGERVWLLVEHDPGPEEIEYAIREGLADAGLAVVPVGQTERDEPVEYWRAEQREGRWGIVDVASPDLLHPCISEAQARSTARDINRDIHAIKRGVRESAAGGGNDAQ